MNSWELTHTWCYFFKLILIIRGVNPYFLKYFELDFNSAEIEYFLKIKEGNEYRTSEVGIVIDKIWIFKTTATQFERFYIAFGNKNQSQVHGVVTWVKKLYWQNNFYENFLSILTLNK